MSWVRRFRAHLRSRGRGPEGKKLFFIRSVDLFSILCPSIFWVSIASLNMLHLQSPPRPLHKLIIWDKKGWIRTWIWVSVAEEWWDNRQTRSPRVGKRITTKSVLIFSWFVQRRWRLENIGSIEPNSKPQKYCLSWSKKLSLFINPPPPSLTFLSYSTARFIKPYRNPV